MDEESAAVIDHFNYDVSDDGEHTRIVVSPKNLISSPTIVGEQNTQPLLFEGTGLILDKDNTLVLPILTADSTAYSYNPKSQVYICCYPGLPWRQCLMTRHKSSYQLIILKEDNLLFKFFYL